MGCNSECEVENAHNFLINNHALCTAFDFLKTVYCFKILFDYSKPSKARSISVCLISIFLQLIYLV